MGVGFVADEVKEYDVVDGEDQEAQEVFAGQGAAEGLLVILPGVFTVAEADLCPHHEVEATGREDEELDVETAGECSVRHG